MPDTQVRVVGSGFTTFSYRGTPLAWLENVQDSGQTPYADGSPVQAIYPIGVRYAKEIVTTRVLSTGTIVLTLRELWNAPVWHQLGGLEGAWDIIQVYERLAQEPSFVTCQTIIQPPGGAPARGKVYHNCLGGETGVITSRGTVPISELAGGVHTLLTSRGWRDAPVRSFGEQEVYEITLARHGVTKTIKATAEHRWFTAGRKPSKSYGTEVLTKDLAVGSKLVSAFHANNTRRTRPSGIGVAHGIVFGDGTREKSGGSRIDLIGEKNASLLRFFPEPNIRKDTDEMVVVADLPGYFKDLPSLDESASYLYGWLAGYFAADGCVQESGAATLSSASRSNLEFVQAVCNRLGLRTGTLREQKRVGIDGVEGSLYHLTILRDSLSATFFVLDNHFERFIASPTVPNKRHEWTVTQVRQTGESEEVFCAVVDEVHDFALEDNILTGNCLITAIDDRETITSGAMSVPRNITLAYTHTTPV